MALSGMYTQSEGMLTGRARLIRRIVPVGFRTRVRQAVAPLSFPGAVNAFQVLIKRVQPDLIHAMRIPYEGMIASMTMKRVTGREGNFRKIPLLLSVWGNDFTLHAKSTSIMAHYTRMAVTNCDGLHIDCQRDQRLAAAWGFEADKPSIVLPGGGGVQMDLFYPPENAQVPNGLRPIEENVSIKIINPRGFRAYVRNDTFFHAIPSVIIKFPKVHFVCPGMKGEEEANMWVSEMGIGDKVDLLPLQTRQQMAELFRSVQISVSITTHDGTPNTLLEALACGCFPIAGDIESLREWIRPGENGFLVDPGDPTALAEAILNAISRPELLELAKIRNLELVKERAEYRTCMQLADEFYTRLILNK